MGPGAYLYEEFDPARWEELLCPEMHASWVILRAEGNEIVRLGTENVKAPATTAVLGRVPGEATLARLREEAARLGEVNAVEGGVGCARHYTGLDWIEIPPRRRPNWKVRLRAWLAREFGW